jgi:polar amino acid transport system permease protein
VITIGELTLRSEQLASTNFEYVPVFIAAGVLYLIATSVIALFQGWLEAHLDIERRARLIGQAQLRAREAGVTTPALAPTYPSRRGQLARMRRRGRGSQVPVDEASPAEALGALAASREAYEHGGEPYVRIVEARKSFHGREVLKDVSLDVYPGNVVFLIGPSGSGKTTLLRTINHLETIEGGEILVGGRHVGYRRTKRGLVPTRDVAVARAKARIGMVFQHFNLFDHLTVLENIMEAPVRVYGRRPADVRREARGLLAWAGLAEHENHYPHQLSGGQQQRIAIIRALATHPRLMLFDEPTSALDPELVGEVLQLIRKLAESGMTMVVVSHEIVFARDWADKVVFMKDGRIVEESKPEEFFANPKEEQTRVFLRMLDARFAGATAGADGREELET